MIYKTLKKISNVCQLIKNGTFQDGFNGWSSQEVSYNIIDGICYCTINAMGSPSIFTFQPTIIKYHKYLISFDIFPNYSNSANTDGFYLKGDIVWYNIIQKQWNKVEKIVTVTWDTIGPLVLYVNINHNKEIGDIANFKNIQIFDLTEMYGAGNEPTTVEQFRQDFPDELYDYKPYCFVKSYKSIMICKTKNLFPTSTVVGTLSGWNQSTARQFEEDKWYIGISGTNYYIPSNIYEYKLTENYVYINSAGSGYGIGKAFKCEPNQTYTISCKWVENTNYMQISIGFYDGNGNYLSYNAAANLAERHTVTTPANCKWFTVCFVGNSSGSSYVYNIQLEKGSTSTDFVPNGYIQSYKKSLICTTKNLVGNNQVYKLENSTNKIIWQGEISERCVFSWYQLLNSLKDPSAALFQFNYSDGSIQYAGTKIELISRGYFFINRSASKKLTSIILINWGLAKGSLYNLQLELGDTATEYHPYGYL